MQKLTTLGDFLNWAENAFSKAGLFFGHGTDNAWDEACALARYVLELPPDVDKTVMNRLLTASEKERLLQLANRRIEERRPVPYLIHEAWFASLKFYVDERVIIPRSPFGELIQEGFQPWLGKNEPEKILDLCTGSGCIAIAAAMAFPNAKVDAVDISKDALAVANKNVQLHHLEDRVRLLESDLFTACKGQQYDIIISNPPYVDERAMAKLPKEFRFEPSLALEAGRAGLDIVERILEEASKYLTPKGLLFVEVGESAEALMDEMPMLPFTWLSFERGGEGIFLLTAEELKCGKN